MFVVCYTEGGAPYGDVDWTRSGSFIDQDKTLIGEQEALQV